MKVEDLMSRGVVSCFGNDSLKDAAASMWRHDCGALPVLDRDGHTVVGMVTDRDICMGALTKGLPLDRIHVTDVMSRDVVWCRPEDDVSEVQDMMRVRQIRRLPVLDAEHRAIGIVSLNDLAVYATAATGAAGRELEVQLAETLGAICQHREIEAV